MIVDRQGRRFRNLRISLTSACNYACTYCVPNGKRLVAAQDELSAEAMARGVEYLIEAAGIDRLRITGGEPLVSPKLEAFMGAVGGMGLSDISLTTNGQLLARKLPLLVEAGIKRINVSLDTLDADAFRSIARGGDLVLCSTAWTRPALPASRSRSIWCRYAARTSTRSCRCSTIAWSVATSCALSS